LKRKINNTINNYLKKKKNKINFLKNNNINNKIIKTFQK